MAQCALHKDRIGTASCERCGDFICRLCSFAERDLHCPRCREAIHGPGWVPWKRPESRLIGPMGMFKRSVLWGFGIALILSPWSIRDTWQQSLAVLMAPLMVSIVFGLGLAVAAYFYSFTPWGSAKRK